MIARPGSPARPGAQAKVDGTATPPRACLAQAVRWLAVRDHFAGDLERKLLAKGYEVAEVAAVIADLTARHYLDDVRAARGYLAARLNRGLGRARLRQELVRRGASTAAIEEAFAELEDGPDDELARARAAASAWRPGGRAARDRRLRRAALARHLAQRGFPAEVVGRVLAAEQTGDAADGVGFEEEI